MIYESIIHAKFTRQKNKSPNSVALRDDENILTYQQVEQRANALAQQLIKRGIRPKDIVGVYLKKGSCIQYGE